MRILRSIVRRAREAGATPVLLGMDIPSNYGSYGGEFTELYVRVAESEDILLVPEFIRDVGVDSRMMQPDGLHPTAGGHRRLAETLAPYLRQVIEGQQP